MAIFNTNQLVLPVNLISLTLSHAAICKKDTNNRYREVQAV